MSNNIVPVPLNKRDNAKLIKMGFLGNFANFIRNKTGLTNAMTPEEMPDYIRKMDLQFVNPTDVFSIYTETQWANNWNDLRNVNTPIITGIYIGENVGTMFGGINANTANVFRLGPVCGPNVTNMTNAYSHCFSLIGNPACGPKVISMVGTYNNCYNLTGSPVCGPNVKNMKYTYNNCVNLTGSPVCGPNVTDMSYTYYNCSNLTGSPVCGPNVTDMRAAYTNCNNLTGSPICGHNVTDISTAYYNCTNLTGSPVCGPIVTSIASAYVNCRNLTGSPVCGPSVTGMSFAYSNCTNLTGSPVCGPNVTDMRYAYLNCQNLTGSIKIPESAVGLSGAFANTRNISSIYITGSRTNANLANTFNRAAVLAELNEGETLPRMNIIFSTGGANLLNNVKIASVTGCTMTAVATVSGDNANIEFPWTYGNGEVYFRNNVTVKRGCYNVLHNIYMYTVN